MTIFLFLPCLPLASKSWSGFTRTAGLVTLGHRTAAQVTDSPALCSEHSPQRFPPYLQPRFFVPRCCRTACSAFPFWQVDGNRDKCCSNYALSFLRSKTEPEVLQNGPLVLFGNARSHRVHALSIPAALTASLHPVHGSVK